LALTAMLVANSHWTSRSFPGTPVVRVTSPKMFAVPGGRKVLQLMRMQVDTLLGRPAEDETSRVDQAAEDETSGERNPRAGKLILVRHGQSTWNLDNRFTGWANVPLSDQGRNEAEDAAELLLSEEGLDIDICYTSILVRSIETATICLDAWEAAGRRRPEIIARWRLNERHYGGLTGLNKREALTTVDASDLRHWRSSFDGCPPPMTPDHPHYSRTRKRYERLLAAGGSEPLRLEEVPLTESLADTVERVGILWQRELQPTVMMGQTVLVIGHANCLRALISCIQGNLNDEHLPSLGVPNALPLVYSFDGDSTPARDLPGRCYIRPLDAYYLGEECVLFNELDVDGSGALDASEFDASEYCQVAWDDMTDFDLDELEELTRDCGERLRSEADNNNDGVVDFNEYMNWWSKLPDRKRGRGGGGSRASRIRLCDPPGPLSNLAVSEAAEDGQPTRTS